MKSRVLRPDELPSEAEQQRVHDRLTLLLWAYREQRRLSDEFRRGMTPLYANAIRRHGGSSAMN